ncbi:MAG: hypothetical protein ACXAEI_14005, partial [Candidatus Hodarchaeales archaeon]
MEDTKQEILEKIAKGELTVEEGQHLLEKLEKAQRPFQGRYESYWSGSRTIPPQELERLLANILPNVTPEFMGESEINAMEAGITYRQLKELVLQHVSPEYIQELKELGYELTEDWLAKFVIHGVDAEFITGLQEYGYAGLSERELFRSRIHDVTADFIRELQDAGYTELPISQLTKMRIHDVTIEFIVELKELGYEDLTPNQLVKFRIHDISPDY